MNQGVVVASVLVMGGMLVGNQPAAAAPALPPDQALRGEVIVQQLSIVIAAVGIASVATAGVTVGFIGGV